MLGQRLDNKVGHSKIRNHSCHKTPTSPGSYAVSAQGLTLKGPSKSHKQRSQKLHSGSEAEGLVPALKGFPVNDQGGVISFQDSSEGSEMVLYRQVS